MFFRLTTPILLAVTLASPSLAQPGSSSSRPTMFIHGNYCGPGNKSPLAPIDVLDAACARHDACTPDDALPSKACNRRLQVEAERIANDPGQPTELRMVAGVVASGAAMMPFAEAGRMTHRAVMGGGGD
ncbi:hypothetical protein FV234_17375 [Methylobacterium sp. WL8]|nr:hypothetical protein FV234_17375 [Methylobacterium sp. WL8]